MKKLKIFFACNPTVQPYYILTLLTNTNLQQCTPLTPLLVNKLLKLLLRQSGLWNVMCAVRASSSSSASPVAR